MCMIAEGSLEVKLPTIWTDEKQRSEEAERREEKKRDDRRERVRRKKMQMREKVGKSRNTVFPMICGSGGSNNCTPLWCEAHFQVKMYKAHQVQSTFCS